MLEDDYVVHIRDKQEGDKDYQMWKKEHEAIMIEWDKNEAKGKSMAKEADKKSSQISNLSKKS
jgi:hypothetical protein